MLAVLFHLLVHVAPAQDDTFDLDPVLVATWETEDPALRGDANRLRALLERTIAADHVVVPMAEVPRFSAYGADVYLRACPAGQYADCAFVVGQRAGAEWVVGGQLGVVDGAMVATVSFIDVQNALLLVQAEVMFDGTEDEAAAATVRDVLDSVLGGQADTVDLRVDADRAPDEAEVDLSALEAASEELAALEAEDGEVERDGRRRTRRSRLTAGDVARYEGTDGTTPWQDLGMSKVAYLRYRNGGLSLPEFRLRQRGRMGEILVGATFATLGSGPFTQTSENWYAIESFTLDLADQYVLHDLQRGFLRSWELSLGVGVLPWLDVAAYGGPRITDYAYRVQRIVEGETPRLEELTTRTVTTWHVGGRVGFYPLPAFPARPTLQAGVHAWWGTPRSLVVDVPDGIEEVSAPFQVLLHAAPGVEVDVGRLVHLWARFDVEVPLLRRVADPARIGGSRLPEVPPADATDEGVSLGGSVGITLRLRVKPKSTLRGAPSRSAED